MEVLSVQKFAIVGLGCRMPPNANSLAAFWRFLLRGGNALKPHRPDRWDVRQFFDPDPKRPGKTYAPKAASLDADPRQFDPLAFGMSPREAASLDPQQRLLLEVAWEAFEDAGMPLEGVAGSATGVFVGGFCLDHLVLQTQPSNRHLINAHSPGGVMMTVLSNRISHAFDLRGPSLTLDTACSSSLVALHYACQSLRLRECDMALAGGVNVMMRPDFPIIMSKGHFLSDHGECRAFDASAAGYARGEGAGVFLLKRYEDAMAAGDPIHAVVSGSGVNQDGHTDGISLPNSDAQLALVRDVYRRAGVAPGEVDYVEAHGTGTQAGDPAELAALNAHFSNGRDPARKLLVGSVKTNVGHLEAAAGVAGLLKAIGALKHRQVPQNLHFKTPNPKIPFADYALAVVRETTPLPSAVEKPTLYVAVNSFGYGGTNAHVLLESAPPERATAPAEPVLPVGTLRLIPFSARGEEALRDLAGKFAFQLGQNFPGSLDDVAHTTAFRRSHLPVRGVAVAATLEELREQWIATSTGQPHAGVALTAKGAPTVSAPVFVFTGMGPQWWGMGQELIRTEPVAAAALDEIDEIFEPLAGWSLKAAMRADEAGSRMARTEVAQPANFALQVALARWWAARGVRPAAVIGHSVGEVTAAYVAGVYSLEEAVRVSFHRSRLQQTAAGLGAMLAVGLPEAGAEALIAGTPGVSIAAINSFGAVTISGDVGALQRIAAELSERGVFQKFLRVEVAYHSPQMDPLRDDLLAALADLSPQPARLPLYSTAFGGIVPGETWDGEYWWRNVRQTVRFADAVRALLDDGFAAFLEVGPHPVLGNAIKECAAHLERKVVGFPSLRRQEPELARLRLTLAELYCAGVAVDWSALAPATGRFLAGPQYPWQRQTYWVESERSKLARLGRPGSVYLNRPMIAPAPAWEVEINANYFPFLGDHRVQDQTVFAGMGYLEAALALSREVHGTDAVLLENVTFERVLIVDPAKLQSLVTAFDPDRGRFAISSRVEGDEAAAARHCRGRLVPLTDGSAPAFDLATWQAECDESVPAEAFYDRLARRHLHYGPMFRRGVELRRGGGRFLLKIDAGELVDDETSPLPPAIFDAALQAVIFCAGGEQLFVPSAMERFHYAARPDGTELYAAGRILEEANGQVLAYVWLTDGAGRVFAVARNLTLQVIELAGASPAEDRFYAMTWRESSGEDAPSVDGAEVLVLADPIDSDLPLARALIERLPGAVGEEISSASGSGFHREEFSRILASHPARRRIVVLWGSGAPAEEAEAVARLNEKTAGLLQAIAADGADGIDVTFVTRRARAVEPGERPVNVGASSLSALLLTAQNENDGVRGRAVDLDDDPATAAGRIASELAWRQSGEFAWRDGRRFERSLGLRPPPNPVDAVTPRSLDEPVELRQAVKGRRESLRYEPGERRAPGAGEVELRLHHVALNDRDLLKIEGRLPVPARETTLGGGDIGLEGAGEVVRSGSGTGFSPGDRVLALLPRAVRTYATIPEALVVKAPVGCGAEAAGILVAYLAAHRALVDVANLRAGERVLVHHGTGGVGLAAINVARGLGARIFATAGSEEKRRYLRDLGVEQVFSSRDLDFGLRLHEATNDEGVDVVIGGVSGAARNVGLGLLRAGGRYLEIGGRDLAEDDDLPLRAFTRNVIFAAVDVDRLARERPELVRETMATIMARFEAGLYHPVPVQLFPARAVRDAVDTMASSRHVGRVVLDLSAGEVDVHDPRDARAVVRPDGAYLVTGGTSGFGLLTARWLAAEGAGKIVLVSRSGAAAPGLEDAIRPMRARGAEIEVCAVDMTDADQVRTLIERLSRAERPLRGIVHGAMVLDDARLADLSQESFRRVFRPKALGALHLAAALAGTNALDFLLFSSSVSALVGNRGQTSYVAANAVLDGLAAALRADGIPAMSVNWGALAESGVVARSAHLGDVLTSTGITGLTDEEALDALAAVLRHPAAQIGVFKVEWGRWFASHPALESDSRFRALAQRLAGESGSDVASQLRARLADSSREQRLRALEDLLQEVLAGILKMAKDAISVDRKINELGVDSLMVLELGLGIEERLGARFSAMELLKGPTLQQLAAATLSKLWKD